MSIADLQVCIRCHEECVECEARGASNCGKCKHYRYGSEEPHTCVSSCPIGTHYANNHSKQCEPCHEACRLVEFYLLVKLFVYLPTFFYNRGVKYLLFDPLIIIPWRTVLLSDIYIVCRSGCTGSTNWDCLHCVNYKVYNDTALDDILDRVIADTALTEHNSTEEPVTVRSSNLKALILNSTTMRPPRVVNIANFSEDGNYSLLLTALQGSAPSRPLVKVRKILSMNT